MIRRTAITLVVLCVSCSAKSVAPPSGPTSNGGAGGTGGASGNRPEGGVATGDSGLPTACTDDSPTPSPGSKCILSVNARAIDENDQPLGKGLPVSACGATQCNPGVTNDDGVFHIGVGFHIVPANYSVQIHVRPDRTAFYFQLPTNALGPAIEMGNLRTFTMPTTGPALQVDRNGVPAQSVTSGDVTLDVPDGLYVRLDVESNLAGDKGKEFRALRIPDAFVHEFADPSLGAKALYALEPFECSFETPGQSDVPVNVRLSFANSAKLAAGSAVELLALGSYLYPDWIPPATFQVVSKGHVSADGSTITLDPGEGLPYLTWVLLRLAP